MENGHRNPLSAVYFGREVRRLFPAVRDGKVSPMTWAARTDAYVGLQYLGEDGGDPPAEPAAAV